MDPIVVQGLMMIAAIFGIPALSMALWFVWREMRDMSELADYYCEQWEQLAARQHEADW
jgi:hypothetical protein